MSLIEKPSTSGPSTQYESNFKEGFEVTDELLNFQPDAFKLRSDEKYCGFDNNVGESWIYPTNYPMRKYQFEITNVALFKNTLVVLPTGLGKTFLAAVVMYNFYRWYPRGKVIFMAPTRPLVAQQIEACYQIMGIPKCDTLELTGKQSKQKRLVGWRSHRVFFVTPQVLAIDLIEKDFPINDIKLIVVDEAHKAKGKYAYTEVIKIMSKQNRYFRILALSATPGRQLKDVAEVVRNLQISHIEVRSESSSDVMPYTYKKNIQTIVVRLNESIREIRNVLMGIISPYVELLLNENVIQGSLTSLTRGWLVLQQKTFVSNSCQRRHPEHSSIMANFAVCISLYHSLELLERHGVRIFLNFFDNCNDKYYLTRDADLMSFLCKIRETVGSNPLDTLNNLALCENDLDFGHPKYELLKKQLVKHFENNSDTKAMVFCEFRESVLLVHQLLRHLTPLIRSQVFIGQGISSGGGGKTQKQQIETMNSFRQGVINVLIATCVAEEGIDVGEIDLIVCFDISTKNPIRLVQRIGRTGRRRDGKVIMLVTEGKEQTILKDVMASKDLTNQKISECQEIRTELFNSPRMVPTEFDPHCIETYIKIEGVVPLVKQTELSDNHETIETALKTNRKNSKKLKKNNNLCDLRQYFKSVNKESDVLQELGNISISSIDYNNTNQDMGAGHHDNDSKSFTKTTDKAPNENINKHLKVLNTLKQLICEAHQTYLLPHTPKSIKSSKDFFLDHSNFYKYLINTTKFDEIFDKLKGVQTDELNMANKCIDEDDDDEKNINNSNIVEIKNQLTQYQNVQTPQFIELDSKYKSQWTIVEDSPVRKCSNKIEQTHVTSTPNSNRTAYNISKDNEFKLMDRISKPNVFVETNKETSIKNIKLLSGKQESENLKIPEKRDIKDVLSYFRLSSIWELFVPTRHRCNSDLIISLDNLNKSLRKNSISNDSIKKIEKTPSFLEQSFIAASPQKTNKLITKLHRKKNVPIVNNTLKVTISTLIPQNQKEVKLYVQPEKKIDISNLFKENFSSGAANKDKHCGNNNRQSTSSSSQKIKLNLIDKDINASKGKLIDVGHLEDIFCDSNDENNIFESAHSVVNKSKGFTEEAIPAKRQTSKDLFDITLKSSDELSSSLKENKVPLNLSQNGENNNDQIVSINNLDIKTITSPKKLGKKSPSAINRRLNFSRLKTARLKQFNSMPANLSANKSLPPIFQAYTEVVTHESKRMCQQHATKEMKNKDFKIKRLNFQDFQYQPSRIADESRFFTDGKKKPPLKLNYSDDDASVSGYKQHNRTNVVSNSSSTDDDFENLINKTPAQKSAKQYKSKKRKKNPFLLDECNVSDADGISSDEYDGPTQFIKWDSICVTDDDEITQNPEIDMQAKYLHSIKSPIRIRGFRIPEIKNNSNSLLENDFTLENGYQDGDSFVVTNEAEIENEINNTLCPLEKAEKILKERKRQAKRKRQGIDKFVSSAEEDTKIEDKRRRKRRKILPTIVSSDEDAP